MLLTESAPAKVNLFLHVDRVKPNGRHDLQSLVLFADDDAADRVSFEPGGDLSFSMTGQTGDLGDVPEDNLVLRAARALLDAANHSDSGALTLAKHLPIAAGIGGGSADAAATLRVLSEAFQLDLAIAERVAPALGGDVPVALLSSAAMMEGEGERVTTVRLPAPVPALLVNPGVPCPTGPIFAAYDAAGGGRDFSPISVPDFSDTGEFIDWCTKQRNDLQGPAIALVPEISDVLQRLAGQSGVRLSRMSGSGATCFALFETRKAAQDAMDRLKAAHPDWWICCTHLS